VVGKVGNRAEGEDSVLEEERQGGVEDRALVVETSSKVRTMSANEQRRVSSR
jgi:hypothetical protein